MMYDLPAEVGAETLTQSLIEARSQKSFWNGLTSRTAPLGKVTVSSARRLIASRINADEVVSIDARMLASR